MSGQKKKTTVQKKEFPVTADEFASSLPVSRIESRDAFLALMHKEFSRGTRKNRAEWQNYFDLFMKKPVALDWEQWLSQNNGGKS